MDTTQPFSTGAHQSPRDYRDVPLDAVIAAIGAASTPRPSSHIEDVATLPRWNQKKIGSCTGHAGGKYKQHLDRLETGNVLPYSPRFLYAIAKSQDGFADEGTYPRLIAATLKNIGCATEATVPNDCDLSHEDYVYHRNKANIPAAAFAEAAPAQIDGYAFPNVADPDSLKDAILKYHGAMLLLRLGEEWWKRADGVSSWQSKDIVPLRPPKNAVGGHEVFLFGYEDVIENGRTRTKFYIFNSWSADWGDAGIAYFYFDEYAPFLVESITFVDLPNDLKQRIKQLPSADTFRYNFASDIVAGDRGADVVALQTALMIDGEFDRELYTELLGSGELGYFKPNGTTQKALLAYQIKHNIDTPKVLASLNGSAARSKTRAFLNSQFNK